MTFVDSSLPAHEDAKANASQQFLDAQQYSMKSLTKYEEIFGTGFISTGGILTTESFFSRPTLTGALAAPGEVLDVGCGIGGGDIFLAKKFPAISVHGVDLATNCVRLAKQRLSQEAVEVSRRVQFEVADVLTCDLPKEHYTMVYSRDVILHIADKADLFKRLFEATKAGGCLFITDYCQGHAAVFEQASPSEPLSEWRQYVSGRGYTLCSVSEYAETLEAAGWSVQTAEDQTTWFREIIESEMTKVGASTSLSAEDKEELVQGWQAKLRRIDAGFMKWGAFFATKP